MSAFLPPFVGSPTKDLIMKSPEKRICSLVFYWVSGSADRGTFTVSADTEVSESLLNK